MSQQIEAMSFKRGMRIELDGDPYLIMDVHFQSPSARGASTLVKIKVRNLRTDLVTDRTFRSSEKVSEPDFERRQVQFLYRQGDDLFFMDQQSYDQFSVGMEMLGDDAGFLSDGLECSCMLHNSKLLGIELPQIVEVAVAETEPVIAGATVKAQTKSARLETGATIQVPPYIEAGEIVRVDTREARFVARVRR
jgi:elongation factor P